MFITRRKRKSGIDQLVECAPSPLVLLAEGHAGRGAAETYSDSQSRIYEAAKLRRVLLGEVLASRPSLRFCGCAF